MKRYIIKRLIMAFFTVLVVIVINYLIIKLAPGDPARIMAGFDNPSEEYIEAIRTKYHFSDPIYVQLAYYISSLLKGDLGDSFYFGQPVVQMINERLGASLLLSGTSAILAFIIGTAIGLYSGRRPGTILDRIFSTIAYACNSMPSFWLGMMLILVFASNLGWFPTQGMFDVRSNAEGFAKAVDVLHHMVLPVTTLTLIQIPTYFRITKSSVNQIILDDFVTTFRITGMNEKRIFYKFVLKNAILPVITVFGINLAYVITGSTLVETVFSWPGIGVLMYRSITLRDYNVLMGIYLALAISVAVVMILVDVIYAWLDPRIRYE